MRFIGLDLLANAPEAAGRPGDPTRRLSEAVENAVLFEELGFDGFAVGERHHVPFLSSAPPVVLSHIAAVTSRIRLFTGVTLLSVLDPVRVAEDYATLDQLSVEFGDPVFSANGMNPVTRYAELIRHYRDRWAEAGRDPADALVGAGHGQTYVTRNSQDAVDAYRPFYERFAAMVANSGQLPGTFTVYDRYEDFLERGSALVGSPAQVIDKVGRYHEAFGNRLISIGGHPGNLSQAQFTASLELFQAEVAPVLRRTIPDPPWPDPVVTVRRRPAGFPA
jgi:alkanesulfonate monooxygenase SsuD/methylene tetrahydromethanopterin reductase-like flavin-dependent oxidoreductase (luciferase family)